MGYITADRSQLESSLPSIDEMIAGNDKSRFVVKLVSKLNLDKLYANYSSQGGDPYDPEIMLAIWFYSYSQGITSTRKIEELCKYDVRFIYVSANLRPDHCALSRFRQRNLELIADYFVEIVQLGKKLKISEFKEINIDGTKMLASSSKKHNMTEEKLSKKLAGIEDKIKKSLLQRREATQSDQLSQIDEKLARLSRLKAILVQRQQQLQRRKQSIKPEYRKNHQINLVEPQAQNMPKINAPGYNAQAAADSQTHFIVSNDVVAEPNDQNQLSKMHEKTQTNLKADPQRCYNFDSGYHNLEQLDYIELHQIDAVVADPTPENRSINSTPTDLKTLKAENRKVQRADFTYHPEEDYYQCPAGKKLQYHKKRKNGNHAIYIYKSPGCQDCPLIEQCLSKKNKSGIKNICRDQREVLAEKMALKLQSEKAKSRLKTRATTIEPSFGNLKHNLGFRRFSLRGLQKVKDEFNLMCIAHNINILYKLLEISFISATFFVLYAQLCAFVMMSKIRFLFPVIIAINSIYALYRGHKRCRAD